MQAKLKTTIFGVFVPIKITAPHASAKMAFYPIIIFFNAKGVHVQKNTNHKLVRPHFFFVRHTLIRRRSAPERHEFCEEN